LSIRTSSMLLVGALALSAQVQTQPPISRITLDEAIATALGHNHSLLATRTTVHQSLANEITANLRPNPTIFTDWEYLPFVGPPSGTSFLQYLQGSTEGDIGMSYMFERGQKRQHRVQAAKDATAVTRTQVLDTERGLAFQVAQLFVNAQLAESTLDLARQDLKSFQSTVDIGETQFKSGAMSENDLLKLRLQLIQFQTDAEQAELGRAQALSDLRQLLGFESVTEDYDVSGAFSYQPLLLTLPDLLSKAIQNRPDLRGAQLGIAAANSQHTLAQANGKQDVTVSGNYSHVNGISAVTVSVSVPLPIFDRNQGNIAQTRYAITQAKEQEKSANGQVLTDVRDAWQGLQSNERVLQIYVKGSLETARRSREIAEYAFRHGAIALIDLLDAERGYRATELAYRQVLAAYLTSLEQVRQAVGSRSLN
jgi:cobalt-zinc-cadmium efflux system outer membrane protein